MSDFKLRTQTVKGEMAEELVVKFLRDQGCTVYRPHALCDDRAHPIDMIAVHKDKLKIFAVDSKAKARRTYYPDTGIDLRHYGQYSAIQKHNNLDVYLFFVDEHEKRIYGNYLTILDKKREVQHLGKWEEYPKITRSIIYFPLVAMTDIAVIPDESVEALKSLSRRNYTYDATGRQSEMEMAA